MVEKRFPYTIGCFKARPVGGSDYLQCSGMTTQELCSCTYKNTDDAGGIVTKDEITDWDYDEEEDKRSYMYYISPTQRKLDMLKKLMNYIKRGDRTIAECGET